MIKNKSTEWITCCDVRLHAKYKRILSSPNAWMDDEIINYSAAQSMLKQQHPLIGGFQSPTLGHHLATIYHQTQSLYRWLLSTATIGLHFQILAANHQPLRCSLYSLGGKTTKRLVTDLMESREKEVTIGFVDLQEQKGASDCRLFALAFNLQWTRSSNTALYLKGHEKPPIREEGEMKPFPAFYERGHKQPGKQLIPIYCTAGYSWWYKYDWMHAHTHTHTHKPTIKG